MINRRALLLGGGEKVALTQWYHEYGEAGVKEAVEGYAADYPNADVKVQWTPGEYMQILGAALLTDEAPDVFEYEQGGSLDMIRGGQLEDLTELMAPVKDQFTKAVIDRFTFQDKIYAVPQVIDMQLLYYRKSLLEEAGVEPPTTFEELVAAAQAVKSADIGGFFAGNDSGVGVLGTMFIWASGHEQLNEDRTEAAFLTDEFYDALVSYREFVQSGACVNAKGKHVDQAKDFVKWLWIDSDDKQIDFSVAYGTHIPAKDALTGQTDEFKDGPGADAARFVAEGGHANDIMWSGPMGEAFGAAVNKVIVSGEDPKEAFAGFADLAKQELAKLQG